MQCSALQGGTRLSAKRPPDFDRSGRNPAGMSAPALELARIILYLIRRTA